MNARAASDALHARVQAMVQAFNRGAPPPERFDDLASDLARFQAAHVPGYARLCAAHGVTPASIARASQAPAVPTDAFRLAQVFAFDAADAAVSFCTSGTATGARGTHPMRRVDTYDAAALAFGRAMLARGLSLPVAVLVVGPSPAERPDSSLAHMCLRFAREWGGVRSPEPTFFVVEPAPEAHARAGAPAAIDVAALRARVAALTPEAPAIVLATSFGLVHLLDAMAGDSLALPPRSRVMQTGGYKGRSRAVGAADLRRAVARMFAVEERDVVGEYGMTELSSQFWEATAIDPEARHGVYVEPPWARVVAVDAETLAPVPAGAVGIARIEDLANVDSAFAILTQDQVRRGDRGFELLGRRPGAPPRGCSIALDEMLSSRADS